MDNDHKTRDDLLAEIEHLKKALADKAQTDIKTKSGDAFFETIVNSSTQGIIVTRNNRIIYANSYLSDIVDMPISEMIKTGIPNLINFVDSSQVESFRAKYEKIENGASGKEHTLVKIYNNSNKERWLEATIQAIEFNGQRAVLSLFNDITDRIKIELDLKKSQQSLKLSIESAKLAVWDQNFVTGKVIRSKQWAIMLGYSPDEVGPMINDWLDLVHPDDVARVLKAAEQHETGQTEIFDVDHRMKTKDGSWKWVRNWGKIIERDKGGKPVRALGTHLDITDKIAINQIHKKHWKFLDQILNATNIETLIRDKEGKIAFASDNYARSFNTTPTSIIGISNAELWRKRGRSEELIQSWLDEDQRVLESDLFLDYTEVLDYKDGLKCYRVVKKRITMPDGAACILVTYENFTKRYQAEQDLRESEEKFREIAELAPVGIYETDADLKITYANQKAIECFGYKMEDLNKKFDWFEMFPEDQREEVRRNISRVLSGECGDEIHQYLALRRDGTIFPVEFKSAPIIRDGKTAGIRGILEDITERQESQAKLEEAQEQYRLLIDNSLVGHYITQNHILKFANDRLANIFGYDSAKDIIDTHVNKLVATESWSIVDKEVKLRESGEKKTSRYEFMGVKPDGSIVFLEALGTTIDYSGHPAIQGTIIDITERRRAEQELKNKRSELEQILKTIPDAIIHTDTLRRIIYINPAFTKLFGYKLEEVAGKSTRMLYLSEEEYEQQGRIRFNINAQPTYDLYEIYYKKKNGKKFISETVGTTVLDSYGKAAGYLNVLRDITERKSAENKIKYERDRAQQYLDMAGTMLLALNQYGEAILINKKGCEITGYDESEIIGENWFDLMSGNKDTEKLKSSFFKILAGEEEIQNFIETILITKDNRRRLFAWNNALLKNSNGKLIGIISSGEDITDKKEAENDLKASEERFKELFFNAPLAYLSLNEDGAILEVNQAWLDILGYDMTEVIGKNITDILTSDSIDVFNDVFKEFIDHGTIHHKNLNLLRKDGSEVIVEYHGNVQYSHDGKFIRSHCIFQDISERIKAERDLLESEEKYRMLFEAANDAIFLMKDFKFIDCNSETLRIYNCNRKQIINKTPTDFSPEIQPDGQKSTRKGTSKYNKALSGKPQFFEWKHKRYDGVFFDAEVSLNRIVYQSQEYILAIVRDITERKRAEIELRESERRFRLMAEAIEDVFWMTVPDLGQHIYSSPAIEKVWQAPINRFQEDPKFFMKAIHPDDLETYQKIMKDYHYKGKPYECEYRIIRKDGSIKWIYEHASPVTNDKGKVLFMAGVSSDITKRKSTENMLKVSHDFLTLAYSHTRMNTLLDEVVGALKKLSGCEAIGIRILDDNGNIPYESYTGFPCEFYKLESPLSIHSDECMCISVINDDIDTSLPYFTENGSFYMNATTKFLNSLSPEDRMKTRNVCNSFGYESVALVPIKIGYKILGLIHCADQSENRVPLELVRTLEQLAIQLGAIIEKVNAGEALRESEERFRNLVESMNDGLVVVDSELRFSYANERMAEMLQVAQDELIGQNVANFLDSKNKRIINTQWAKRKKGESLPYELEWRREDNSKVVTIISPKSLWSASKEFKGSFSVITDITERKHKELINKAKTILAARLRQAQTINECLESGCKAVANAELFYRAIFILFEESDRISNINYHGLSEKDIVSMKLSLPDEIRQIKRGFIKPDKIGDSYILPSNGNGNGNGKAKDQPKKFILLVPVEDNIVEHTGWLIADTPFPGVKIDTDSIAFIEEIAEIVAKRINELLFLERLQHERQQLEDKNVALREVLASIEQEKMEIRHKVAQKIDQMVVPTLNRIVNHDGSVNRTYYDLLSNTVKELAGSSGGLMNLYAKLSPREVEICNLIKAGSSSKEIADTLHLSIATIQKHRERIRHKLGLANKSINLTSYLKNPN